jgi:hypothetical protein
MLHSSWIYGIKIDGIEYTTHDAYVLIVYLNYQNYLLNLLKNKKERKKKVGHPLIGVKAVKLFPYRCSSCRIISVVDKG